MKIKYYYSVLSPFSHLGIDRFIDLAKKYKIEIDEKPFDLVGEIFPNTGGIPVPQRHITRQKYRLIEIERIGKKYGIEIKLQPKFFPPIDPHLPAKFTLAAIKDGNRLTFGKECLRYLWVKEKNISDLLVLEEICKKLNLDFQKIQELANSEEITKTYLENSKDAIKNDVFGAPTYVFENEMFWGQDRLEYLEDKIK